MKIKLLSKSLIPFKYSTALPNCFTVELMVHALEFHNSSNSDIKIKEISLTLVRGKNRVHTQYLTQGILKEEIRKFSTQINKSIKHFPPSVEIWLSRSAKTLNPVMTTTSLRPSSRVVIGNQFLSLRNIMPTKLVVEVLYAEGSKNKTVSRSFPLRERSLKNSYCLPLRGTAWGLLGPTAGTSHHRQAASQEFGYDFLLFDEKGKICKGKGLKNEDYFCFKKPILAPADGIVLVASDGMEENQKLGDVPPLSKDKISKFGLLHALAGNIIIIKHKNNEYSFLAHCAYNSIKVKIGDKVKKGQRLALLGNTGNSTAPHLHYHLMDGPDFLVSRSLPITFDNIKPYPWSEEEVFQFWDVLDPMVTTN